MTYETQNQRNRNRKDEGQAGRTGSHPTRAKNPSVLAPGLFPFTMSLKPAQPIPYSQGLAKPSGLKPRESRWSLSSEKMAATVCSSEISQVLEDGRSGGESEGKTHGCRAERTVHLIIFPPVDELVFLRLRGDVGDAASIGSSQITK